MSASSSTLRAALESSAAFTDLLDKAARLFVEAFAFYPDTFSMSWTWNALYGDNVDSAAVSALHGMVGSFVYDNDDQPEDPALHVWYRGHTAGADFALKRDRAARPAWYQDPTVMQNLCQRPSPPELLEQIDSTPVEALRPNRRWEVLQKEFFRFMQRRTKQEFIPDKQILSMPRQWAECFLNSNKAKSMARDYVDRFGGRVAATELPSDLFGHPVSWDAPELTMELWRRKKIIK